MSLIVSLISETFPPDKYKAIKWEDSCITMARRENIPLTELTEITVRTNTNQKEIFTFIFWHVKLI